jgi:tetratricopeptide (TPR) repeat protein
MPHVRRLRRPLALLACSLFATALPSTARGQTPPQGQGKTLEQLRVEYAMRFLDPEPHMALAKYFRDSGDRLEAFRILESARRDRFEREDFDAAFKTHFLGEKPFDNSKAAEARLLAEVSRNPSDYDALFKLADIYISREDWPKAKEYLGKLLALRPDNFEDTRALAKVYHEEGKDEEAERVLRDWAAKHPDTADAHSVRVSQIPETEAAKSKDLLTRATVKFPRDARFAFDLAALHQREGRMKEAEELFVRAASLAPNSSHIQAWVGRFFFKAKEDERRALDYYLNAYLLDPHAYETEFVESRIPKISWKLAEARFGELVRQGVPPTKIIEDPNPIVVSLALKGMGQKWRPEYLRTVVELMKHDDGGVRWTATSLLREKADRSFGPQLKALLADADLRRRGLAAYVAVALWRQESFGPIRQMLGEKAQLLRFDAASALILEGGPEGKRIAYEHRLRESHPRLKKLLEKAQAEGETPK